MQSSWLETVIEVPTEFAEVMANRLLEIGSPGLVTEEVGQSTRLTAYFDTEEQVALAGRYAAALSAGALVRSGEISSENWAENWKDHFPPLLVGTRLYLCPPWASTPPSGRIAVVVDPGMAFGTGHHTTTRACLELLESRVAPGCDLLDVGTGSGVLSIAALLLGACRAVGVDVDPLATDAAAENAVRNGVADRLSLSSSLADVSGLFDLAVANIQLNVLTELEPQIAARVRPGGILIASGLLREELDAWKAHYGDDWEIGESSGDAQWVAVAARRRASSGRG